MRKICAAAWLVIVPATGLLAAGAVDEGVHTFRLANGLRVVVAVRPELPLAAANLTVNVGSIDDPPGQSGMAHLLEHVTLSGSTTVGSLDPAAEAKALQDLDRAYRALERARQAPDVTPEILAGLGLQFEEKQRTAQRMCEGGEILGGRLESRGAIGLNATTTEESTHFFTWIPPQHLELWLSLEAERLRKPIFRRFYSERNVVLREVAALTRGTPTLLERFHQRLFSLPTAFRLAGDPSEIANIDRPTALAYFHQRYRPMNIAIAIVGNVKPRQIEQLAEQYFGDWRADAEAPSARVAVRLDLPRLAEFNSVQRPVVLMAFPRDGLLNEAAIGVIEELINAEDLSPLQTRLRRDLPFASSVRARAAYPSKKFSPVFLVQINGNSGVPHARLSEETWRVLKNLGRAADGDIDGAIKAAERQAATQLDDAPTLASLLGSSQTIHGDWRWPFKHLDTLRTLSVQDVRRTATHLFSQRPIPMDVGEEP